MTGPKSGGRSTDGSGTTAWSYNPAGHILTERRKVGTITKTISNTFNLDGSVKEKTYPSGNVITYTYNNAQRATSVKDLAISKNYGTSITYAPHGGLASVLENQGGGFAGITYTRSYNNRLQLTAAQATSVNGTAFDLGFSYDLGGGVNNGNLATLTNNKPLQSDRSVTYTYDTLNRIATAETTGSSGSFCWGQSFGYDRYGNLLTVGGTKPEPCSAPTLSLIVDNGNHILDAGYAYDAAGNMTLTTIPGGFTRTLAYDAENRVKSSSGITYTHDGDGWRVKKSNGDLEWYDSTCGGRELLSVFDLSGVLKAEYYYIGSMLFASRSFYYFGDNVNSVRVVTNTTGVVQRESDYYAYGGEIEVTNIVGEVKKFTGKKRDTESTLDYSHFRMFQSNVGRWTATDPVLGHEDNPQSWNRYGYVLNNPANLIDPDGSYVHSLNQDSYSFGGGGTISITVWAPAPIVMIMPSPLPLALMGMPGGDGPGGTGDAAPTNPRPNTPTAPQPSTDGPKIPCSGGSLKACISDCKKDRKSCLWKQVRRGNLDALECLALGPSRIRDFGQYHTNCNYNFDANVCYWNQEWCEFGCIIGCKGFRPPKDRRPPYRPPSRK